MEDFKLILYILAAIAFFLYNTWRKAFKGDDEALPPDELPERRPAARPQPQPPLPQPRAQPTAQRPAAPPTSFEDILRELQPKAERAKEQARPVAETISEKAAPTPPLAKPQPVRTYERAPRAEVSLEEQQEAREATRREQRKRMVAEPYAPWKAQVKTNKYAEILRNPQGARDAFILSEIFNRKYK